MAKSSRKKSRAVKKDIHYHIRHKSRLTFLLIIKVLLVFLISLLVFRFFYFYFLSAFGLILAWIFSFIIAACIYLFIVTRLLKLLKF